MEDPTFFNQYPMELDYFACPPDDFDLLHSLISIPPEIIDSSPYHSNLNYQTTPTCSFLADDDQTCDDQFVIPSPKPSNMPSNSSPILPSQLISFDHTANLVSKGSCEDNIFSNNDNRANQTGRNPIQAQEHIISERKRREKLSRNFVALSAILPGLRRMDRGSVLGGAIRYVKQLQEQVKTLEEQAARKGIGSAVLVKKSVLFINDDDSDQNSDSHCYQSLPEIRVTVSGVDLLIKIHYEKRSECAGAAILRELEKNDQLTVHTFSFLPFGNSIIDATIIAKMNKENSITAKDLLRSLHQALKQFI